MCPCVDDLIVSFIEGDESHTVVLHNLLDGSVTFLDQLVFLIRNKHICQVERQATLKSHVVTQILDIIQEFGCCSYSADLDYATDNIS